jgi:MoxR-like ATPase
MWPMALAEFTRHATLDGLLDGVQAEVRKAVVGQDKTVELLLVAAVSGGHVLLEGPPGIAKTLLSGSMARALGVQFNRVQFTSDTKPEEITGTTRMRAGERVFMPGPIFTNVLLADEINRTPPRTQASLLEAMQERHVTVDGATRWLPTPFLVVATQNPYEQHGVFGLPESQLDRFLFKIRLSYGSEDDEIGVLGIPHRGLTPDMLEDIRPLAGPVELQRAQHEIDETEVSEAVARATVRLVRMTRDFPGVVLGCSPRSSIHLLVAAKANARLAGRSAVTLADIVFMAPFVLPHRLIVEPSVSPIEIVSSSAAAIAAESPDH